LNGVKNKVSNGVSYGINKITGRKEENDINNNTYKRNYNVDENKYPNFKQHEIGNGNGYISQRIDEEIGGEEVNHEYLNKKKN